MLERTLHLLEYDKVKEQLIGEVHTSLGREKVTDLKPSFDLAEAQAAINATDEALTVLRLNLEPSFRGIADLRPFLKRARLGSRLDGIELYTIADTIAGGRRLKNFLERVMDEDVSLPYLQQLQHRIFGLRDVEQEIRGAIDDEGKVLDEASPELSRIRRQIRNLEQRIRTRLDQIMRTPATQKMMQEPLVTIRNERYCLPIKAEYRHAFHGLVHDQSASGATLFIEPEPIVALTNERTEAKRQEEKEIEAILRRLTARVGEVHEELHANLEVLAELDFCFAKAAYARGMNAVLPKLNAQGHFRLIQARHPLISAEEVVPNTIVLGEEYTCLVITGPNTGGKTVTLKTLGLLTLMACSGLFIPAEEESQVAVAPVYADIGDEQSIEQSLSTFSSHLKNIVEILDQLEPNCLVLFDELGAGTDPVEGAALAMAILDAVHRLGARVVATTHYSELKGYAYVREGVRNASVEFDVETLQPTYRLLTGVPGRSNAFHIARRLGLAEEIISAAQSQVNVDDRRVDRLLQDLEDTRKEAEQDKQTWQALKEEVEELKRSLADQQARLTREKENLLAQAREEAEQEMTRILREAEGLLDELRTLQKEGAQIKEHRLIEAQTRLKQFGEDVQGGPSLEEQTQATFVDTDSKGALEAGDEVIVSSFGQKGQILEKLADDEYVVQLGLMKMKVKGSDLKKVKGKQRPEPEAAPIMVNRSTTTVKLECDVRGQRAEEAIAVIDKYLDDALLAGYQEVSIIHGKGTGQLRKGVQAYLKQHRRVKQFRLGGAGEGGSGVTIVSLS